MTTLSLLTALVLPAVTTAPSVQSIQWTDDGQAVLRTAGAILVLVSFACGCRSETWLLSWQTPDPGVHVERSSVIKQELDKDVPVGNYKPVGWLRTMFKREDIEMYPWAAECGGKHDIRVPCSSYNIHDIPAEWGTVALGSLVLSFVSATASPSNLSRNAGYVHAARRRQTSA